MELLQLLFAEHTEWLLVFNGLLAVSLGLWVLVLGLRLWRRIRRRQFGARMTARFVWYFILTGMIPGVLIYVLSVQFLSKSIESWFNVRVDTALQAGQSLGRTALDHQLLEVERRTQRLVQALGDAPGNGASALSLLRENAGVADAMIFTTGGRLLAFSSEQYSSLVPSLPPPAVMNQLRLRNYYAEVESNEDPNNTLQPLGFTMRVVLPLGEQHTVRALGMRGIDPDKRWLQVIQPVPEKLVRQINQVQQGHNDYLELALSREGLGRLYQISLTFALILAMFAAVAAAIALSKRLVRPLLRLASGTQAVGVGDFRPLPEPARHANDEVGQLTRSFNIMTRQLDEARQAVENNRAQLERSNVYLESVLSHLSSGVLVFDESRRLTRFNAGAQAILQTDLSELMGQCLNENPTMVGFGEHIWAAFAEHLAVASKRAHWQQQFETQVATDLDVEPNTITLLARGTTLLVGEEPNGYLVVFDDISEVISANRLVAWGEVARRLAHEIKNPLTPIQLSAERLALRLANKLDEHDAGILNRSTTTIINQVSSLKKMVEDFREYARTPPAQMQAVDLNALITDVLNLYGWDPQTQTAAYNQRVQLQIVLQDDLPLVEGDPTQLRQIVHNLLSNATEAVEQDSTQANPCVVVRTRLAQAGSEAAQPTVRFVVSDNGPGFDESMLSRVFEPYITTKATGTGLGLAIVKKIIDEHGGKIDIANRQEGGARISILFSRLANAAQKRHN